MKNRKLLNKRSWVYTHLLVSVKLFYKGKKTRQSPHRDSLLIVHFCIAKLKPLCTRWAEVSILPDNNNLFCISSPKSYIYPNEISLAIFPIFCNTYIESIICFSLIKSSKGTDSFLQTLISVVSVVLKESFFKDSPFSLWTASNFEQSSFVTFKKINSLTLYISKYIRIVVRHNYSIWYNLSIRYRYNLFSIPQIFCPPKIKILSLFRVCKKFYHGILYVCLWGKYPWDRGCFWL